MTPKQRAQQWIDQGIDPTTMTPDDFKPPRGRTMSQATFDKAVAAWKHLKSLQDTKPVARGTRTLTPVEIPLGEPATEGTYSNVALDLLAHPLRVRTLPLGEQYLRAILGLEGEQYCWEIDLKRGGYVHSGYGHGGDWPMHRLSWAWWHGPIPESLHVDHVCGNRRCFNPAHLEAITPEENSSPVRRNPSRHPYPEDLTVGAFVSLTHRKDDGTTSFYRTDGAKRIAAARRRDALNRHNERQRQRYATDDEYRESKLSQWRAQVYGTPERREAYNARRRALDAAHPERGQQTWQKQRNDPATWEAKKQRDRERNQRAKVDPELRARREAAFKKSRAKRAAKKRPIVLATQKRVLNELLTLPTPVRPQHVQPALKRLGLWPYPWRKALAALGWTVETYYDTITLADNYDQRVTVKAYRFVKEED